MRLLLLDFDGVLHSAKAGPFSGERFVWVPLLAQLLKPWPDVRLAVHSTWRYDHTDAELAELLSPMQGRFVGSAPRGPRELAILSFVYALKEEVADWRVLDDSPGEFQELGLERLIVCDPAAGLSAPDAHEKLHAWLSRDPYAGNGIEGHGKLLQDGLRHRATRLEAADMVSVAEAAAIAGRSKEDIETLVARWDLLGIANEAGSLRLPKWQFEPVYKGIWKRLARALGSKDAWTVLNELETHQGALGGLTPRAAIEQGRADRVFEAIGYD